MANKIGKMSIDFIPQGSRYEYHSNDSAAEQTALQHVLAFCDELNKTFVTFVGKKHRPNAWWTEALDVSPNALDQVETSTLVDLVNKRLKDAKINRTLMKAMEKAKDFGSGIVYFGTNEPFPGESGTGSGSELMLEFEVEAPSVVNRTYFIGSDGKVHCTSLLNLLINDNIVDLAEMNETKSKVHVGLKVDFTVQS